MKSDWISRETAIAELGIKPQTLYAYVSRSLIRTAKDESDSRRSLYFRHDIEKLKARKRSPRARADVAAGAIAWGEPVLESRISTVRDGALIFGNAKATDLAKHFTLEDVAEHHWRGNVTRPVQSTKIPPGKTAKERGFSFLATSAAFAGPSQGQSRDAQLVEASKILFEFSNAMTGQPCTGHIHDNLGQSWNLSLAQTDVLRQILVLLSDHELNASTFAVRVATSTGASLAAAALAGYCTLTGPLHGEAGVDARELLEQVLRSKNDVSPDNHNGFGHPFYKDGDIRARHIISQGHLSATTLEALSELEHRIGKHANIDAALAAFAIDNDLPKDASFIMFAVARMAGWMAHALEQVETGALIRPRARFRL